MSVDSDLTYSELSTELTDVERQIALLESRRTQLKNTLTTHPHNITLYVQKVIGALYALKYPADSDDDEEEEEEEEGVWDADLSEKQCSMRLNLQTLPVVQVRKQKEEVTEDDEGWFDESKLGGTTYYTVRYRWADEEITYTVLHSTHNPRHIMCLDDEGSWCLDVRRLCRKILNDGDVSVWPADKHLPILYAYFQDMLDRL